MKHIQVPILLASCLALLVSLAACTSQKQTSTAPSGSHTTAPDLTVAISAGKAFLSMTPQTIKSLSLVRVDPAMGENFSIEFERHSDLKLRPEDRWKITGSPFSPATIDRWANGNWIDHFLDTLTSLHVQETAPDAPKERFGLEPPRYIIRVKSEQNITAEIRLGDAPQMPSSRWGLITASGGDLTPKPVRLEGAALQMLNLIRSPSFLRRERLFTFEADDIDTIELKSQNKTDLSIVRDSGSWVTQQSKKPVQGKIDSWLDQLTHLQIQRFIEDSTEKNMLDGFFGKSKNTIVLEFQDRSQSVKKGEFLIDHQKVWAKTSDRTDVYFELFPEAIKNLRGPAPQ